LLFKGKRRDDFLFFVFPFLKKIKNRWVHKNTNIKEDMIKNITFFRILLFEGYPNYLTFAILDNDDHCAQVLDDELIFYKDAEHTARVPVSLECSHFKPNDIIYLSKNYTIDHFGFYTGKLTKNYPNSSKPDYITTFKQGVETGVYKSYHKNGQLSYKYNHKTKTEFFFYESGKKERKSETRGNTSLKKEFYENGTVSERILWSKHKMKYRKKYSENGQLVLLEKYMKTHYFFKKWHNNGQLATHYYYTPNHSNLKPSRPYFILFKTIIYNVDGRMESYKYTFQKHNKCSCSCWCRCEKVKIGLQKKIQPSFKSCYIIKNHKNVFDLISKNRRFNFTSPYLKSQWLIRPKIIIK
jgi:hypothetical protein